MHDVFPTAETTSAFTAGKGSMVGSVEICLPRTVLNVFAEIYKEHPDLCSTKHVAQNDTCKAHDLDYASECRFYNYFVKLQSLYGSTTFLSTTGSNDEEIKVNAVHRLKLSFKLHGLKTIKLSDVTKSST